MQTKIKLTIYQQLNIIQIGVKFMKKVLSMLLVIMTSLFAICSFSACSDDDASQSQFQLQMGKKYIMSSHITISEYEQEYYVFYPDETGEYRYYYSYSDGVISDYKVKFKYTYTDAEKSSIACFYDSVTYGDEHNYGEVGSNWTRLLMVSKDVVCGTYSSSYYINEDYLNTIPNYK